MCIYPLAEPAFRFIPRLTQVLESYPFANVPVLMLGATLTNDIEVTVNTTTGGSATGNTVENVSVKF